MNPVASRRSSLALAAGCNGDLYVALMTGRGETPGVVAQAPDGSIDISESVKGKIWRVIYTGK